MLVTAPSLDELRGSFRGGAFVFMVTEISAPARFEKNAFYERLLEMRATNRKAFDALSPVSKLALLQYEKLKRAHEQEKEFME